MAPISILVIDDEPMIRWSLEQALRAAGHIVTLAETAADGLACFEALQPDVVFLDLRLPDADGLSVLASIRAARPEVDVIVMTAFGEAHGAGAALRAGAAAYLRKPFDFDTIESLVQRMHARRGPTSRPAPAADTA